MKYKILSLLLLWSFNIQAQKVKLKSKTATYSAIQLPISPLDKSIKTYTTRINSNSQNLWNVGLKKSELDHKYLKLHGYQKLEQGGDLLLELSIGKFEIVKEELEESLKTLKGGDTPENKQYNYTFSFSMPFKMVALQGDKRLFSQEEGWDVMRKREFDSPTFNTAAEASKNKAKYLRKWVAAAKKNFVNNKSQEYYEKLNKRIGFMPIKQSLKFFHPNTKKASQYKPFEAEVQKAISTIKTITANEPIDATTKQTINDLISEWEKKSANLSTADKNQAKLKKAYVHNILKAARMIEDFEKATAAANQLIDEDLEKKVGKRSLKAITNLKENLQKTGLVSRHQNLETSTVAVAATDAISPDKQVAGTNEHFIEATEEEERAKTLGLHEQAKAYEMEVNLRNGYVEKGVFVVDYSNHEDVVFYNRGNYNFFTESVEQGLIRKRFSLSKIKSFDFDGRHFEVVVNKGVNAVSAGPIQVVEERAVASKMTVYTACPMTAETANTLSLTGNYLVKKNADGKIIDLNSLKFLNFKKSFSKFIADCPDLSAKVKNGDLKRNMKNLITIAHEYSACK